MYYILNKEHKVEDYSDVQYSSECQYIDLISQLEYEQHPNKVIVVEIPHEEEVPIYDEDGNIIGYETVTTYTYELALNPDYEQEEAEKRENKFNNEFFKTSLGYIRRKVTMKDGSHKDFLSDLLPIISMGVQTGTSVTILTYDKPDFTQEVIDWEEYQHQVTVTPAFIQECFLQLQADFK